MPTNEKNKKSTATKATGTKAQEESVEEKKDSAGADETGKAATDSPEATGKSKAEETSDGDGEMVEVSKDDLKAFMRRLEDVEADNKRLIEASDKARMAAISERERGERVQLPRVKLTRMGSPTGKLVIAWKMTQNESYVDGNKLVEKQEIELFYHDGTSEKMPLIGFYRKQNKQTIAEILSRTKKLDDPENGEMLVVQIRGTDEKIDIDLKFVN